MSLPVSLDPKFYEIPEDISFEDWERQLKVGLSLGRLVPFRVGDYLNYGEDRWGEESWQVLGNEYDLKTLQNWRWVCRRFPVESGTRSPDIAFGVYLALGAIRDDDRRYTMALRAIGERWKIKKAQDEARPYKPKRQVDLKKAEIAEDLPEAEEIEEQEGPMVLSLARGEWLEVQNAARRILQKECDRTRKISPDMARLAEFFDLSIGRT